MIVVDSAAVVDVLTGVEGVDELRALLSTEPMHAPELLDFEVLSAVRGQTLGGKLTPTRAREALDDFGDLRVTRWRLIRGMRDRAFELRENLSSYDAAYVALAETLGCPLITRDGRLARASGHHADVHVL